MRMLSLGAVALWLGASVFLTFGVGPAIFSRDVLELIPRYHAGRVAQLLLERFFWFQLGCGAAAALLLLADWAYASRAPRRWTLGLLAGLIGLVLLGGSWMQPRLKNLHAVMYAPDVGPDEKAAAASQFGRWHGVSQAANLVVLIGVAVYFVQLAWPISAKPNKVNRTYYL